MTLDNENKNDIWKKTKRNEWRRGNRFGLNGVPRRRWYFANPSTDMKRVADRSTWAWPRSSLEGPAHTARGSRGGGRSGAGFSGILTNYGAYERWAQSSKERTQYLQAAYSLADMLPEPEVGEKHRDVRRAEVLKSERRVTKTVEAIKSFNNPCRDPRRVRF